MNFAGALEKNAGKECTVRSLSWKMKSSGRTAFRSGAEERPFAEKRRKAVC